MLGAGVVWAGSVEAEDFAAGLGDHGLVPGGVPDDFDAGLFDGGKVEEFLLGVAGDGGAHAATGGGEGHFDEDMVVAGGQGGDAEVVDEAEVHDVDGDFRIVTGAEGFPDVFLFDGFAGGDLRGRAGVGGTEAEGIGIFGGNPVEGAVGVEGVGASEALGDVRAGAAGERGGGAGRDLDDFAITVEGDGRDVCHGRQVSGWEADGNDGPLGKAGFRLELPDGVGRARAEAHVPGRRLRFARKPLHFRRSVLIVRPSWKSRDMFFPRRRSWVRRLGRSAPGVESGQLNLWM